MKSRARCDLHVHSVYSTDTGNYALRRARLGESYTEPGRVYEVCRRRGMTLVTISDHNTLEGALRIAHLPGTFLSEEVTTRFPEDDVPLHVLVWGLSEEDHRDLQPYRGSVYELAALLRERRLAHALAHPLYRMGPPLTVSHVERLMLLFAVWEVLNGARPRESNLLARRLAEAATPAYLGKLSERHGLEPEHDRIAFSAGSDDHSALDIACAWSQAAAPTPEAFLEAIRAGRLEPCGSDGSTVKLAHALGALVLNAYRRGGGTLPEPVAQAVSELFDRDAENAAARHEEIDAAAGVIARTLLGQVRAGGISLETLPMLGGRLATVMLAAALEAPFAASLKHNADTQQQMHEIERAFFGTRMRPQEQTALVFTDTFDETNGVAGTMRRLALEAGAGRLPLTVVTTRAAARLRVARAPLSFAARGARRGRAAATGRDPRRDARPRRPGRAGRREAARHPGDRLLPHRARSLRAARHARSRPRRAARRLRALVLPAVWGRARADAGGGGRAGRSRLRTPAVCLGSRRRLEPLLAASTRRRAAPETSRDP
jgi:predicted metal-dependent phosphoesterase TrpH